MHILIVTGLSGAGKTHALRVLEDCGYFCTDNIPVHLIDELITNAANQSMYKIALAIDVRTGIESINALVAQVNKLKVNHNCQLLFFYAQRAILLKRFDETRRKHPLHERQTTLEHALSKEEQMLLKLREVSDAQIDTSQTDIYQLGHLIRNHYAGQNKEQLSLLIQSFGFKYGSPAASDFVFDVRCLPNPYWDSALRASTGQDIAVAQWLESHPEVTAMHNDLMAFFNTWLPAYINNKRSYLTISIGCTGGKHRSVYLAERLAQAMNAEHDVDILVQHMQLDALKPYL